MRSRHPAGEVRTVPSPSLRGGPTSPLVSVPGAAITPLTVVHLSLLVFQGDREHPKAGHERAAAMRALAELAATMNDDTRAVMLRLADDYGKLADRAARAGGEVTGSP